MRYWLMKSEPDVYSIDNLKTDGKEIWDGVRNYQARNFLREMEVGDLAFFYHSNTKPPGIAGFMRVIRAGVVDPTQFDPSNKYYDPKSNPDDPRWQTVEVEFIESFLQYLSLDLLRQNFEADELLILRRGNRLSVVPVEEAAAKKILTLAQANQA
ncbi:MAG: EVE domain-containing protein [Elainellaceae cyanobacterium]